LQQETEKTGKLVWL